MKEGRESGAVIVGWARTEETALRLFLPLFRALSVFTWDGQFTIVRLKASMVGKTAARGGLCAAPLAARRKREE